MRILILLFILYIVLCENQVSNVLDGFVNEAKDRPTVELLDTDNHNLVQTIHVGFIKEPKYDLEYDIHE